MDCVGLCQGFSVDVYLLVDQLDMIAWNADDALHIIHGNQRRVTENDDVAALHILIRKQVLADRSSRRVSQLVDDQMIARVKRIVHRRRWNYERLRDHRRAEEQDENGDRPLGDRGAMNRLGTWSRFRFSRRYGSHGSA